MNSRMSGAIALLTALPLVLAGCTSSTDGDGTTVPTQRSTSSLPPTLPTTPASEPASTPAGSETITAEQVTAALLAPQDVGEGFTQATFQPGNSPLPCLPDEPTVEDKYPSRLRVGTAMVNNAARASLSEEVRLFADNAMAQQAVAYIAQGLNCKSGQLALAGSTVTIEIGKGQDVTSAVGADAALAVQAQATDFNIVLVVTRLGRAAVLFAFLQSTTQTATLPNPIELVRTALDKLK